MMAGKNNETGLFYNRTSSLYNLSQQGYANFLYNQKLNKTAHLIFLEVEWIK